MFFLGIFDTHRLGKEFESKGGIVYQFNGNDIERHTAEGMYG